MKKLLVVIALMCSMIFAQSQLDIAREKINKAYNHNSEKEMLEARALFERLLSSEKDKWLVNYYIAYCDYRLQTFQMQKEDKKQVKAYIKDGIAKLNECLDENENFGEAYALMSNFYGAKISLNPMSGMWNGPKSGKFMAEAMNYSSSSPRVFLLDGIGKYFTPEKWGGGAVVAILSLEKSIELYQNQEADANPSWGKTDVLPGWEL